MLPEIEARQQWSLILSIMVRSILLLLLLTLCLNVSGQVIHLKQTNHVKQLLVKGEPFHILGGELGNSTASWPAGQLDSIFQKLHRLNLNTVLVPAYWELIEPVQGSFSFTEVDDAIHLARKNNLKLVFLWFGAWKNSMSCYAPKWVKGDRKKYPYAMSKAGKNQEIMSPFSKSNLQADRDAFVRFMSHLKSVDGQEGTVLMVQVENEIGMLPDARDYSPDAVRLFESEVPAELIQYLKKNAKQLHPVLDKKWQTGGYATKGNWRQIFGNDVYTDELFMAWYYARYVEVLASEGKKAYNIPMYLNAALNSRGRVPGQYPSAGPLDHLIDIWRCAAPAVDFLAPDIYDPGFKMWCSRYDRPDNPLFIPEIRIDKANAMQAFYVFGQHNALGFSPFSIEDEPLNHSALTHTYGMLAKLQPLMAQKQNEEKVWGVLFDHQDRDTVIDMGSFRFTIKHDYTLGWNPQAKDGSVWPEAGALIIELASNEYLIAGSGVVITFSATGNSTNQAGILSIDEVDVQDGKLVRQARLNGDQNHQGRHLRIPVGVWNIQHLKLYQY